ncbi:hypothetical protein [Streptomyces sp. NPDC055287]
MRRRASGCALLGVAFGRATPEGRLPFELPRSMAAVEASRPDVPNDTRDPVFPYGHGTVPVTGAAPKRRGA